MADSNRLMRLQRRVLGTLSLASLSVGYWMDAPAPLLMQHHPSPDGAPARSLFVLLPGIQDLHHEYELAGFVAAAREQKIAADLLAVDAHIGYYVRESILVRLREDVILPAREKGYEKIWLAGASLGGFGSLLYAQHFGNDIDGLFLMAPFLGHRLIVKDIQISGGIAAWEPTRSTAPRLQVELWKGLKTYLASPSEHPPVHLGYGIGDRFAPTNSFLAEHLPGDRVQAIPGGHDWKTWTKLWSQFLESVKA